MNDSLTEKNASPWYRFKKNKAALVGLVFFAFLVIVTIFAPIIANFPYDSGDLYDMRTAPNETYIFGTDEVGRDIFSRLLYGGRISLTVAFSSMALQLLLGVMLGAIAGYYGGFLDLVLARLMDMILCFPFILIAMSVVLILGAGMKNVIFVLAFLSWPGIARIVRAEMLVHKESDYVLSAKAMGHGAFYIILKEIIPNIFSSIMVAATLAVSRGILMESALSFFGLGVLPPYPSWGNMLMSAQNMSVLQNEWWVWIFPGITIVLAVLSINLISDGLESAFFAGKAVNLKVGKTTRKSNVKPMESKSDFLLSVKDLRLSFMNGPEKKEVLKSNTFAVNHNEIVVLVGESGSGKTVTAHTIMKLLDNTETSGEIIFNNKVISHYSDSQMREIRGREISMIFQNPQSSLHPIFRVSKQIKEVFTAHKIKHEDMDQAVIDLLEKVAFTNPKEIADAYPFALSGGQRQRVMIAMALAGNPKLLLADEPTTALDVSTQKEILALLCKVVKEEECSMLFITHDLGVAAEIADRIIVMYQGHIVETAEINEFFDNPAHPYSKSLLESMPHNFDGRFPVVEESTVSNEHSCTFVNNCPMKMEICLSQNPHMYKISEDHEASCFLCQNAEQGGY